jgi:hypothetical protein
VIRYALTCEHDHPFEAWFASSADYDDQAARGLVECPFCASRRVAKQIMAPAVAGTKRTAAAQPVPQAVMMEAMQRMRRHVEESFDYVGERFAEEARQIHAGEAEARGIYGEASPREVKALVEEGVPIAPLPAAATPKRKARVN